MRAAEAAGEYPTGLAAIRLLLLMGVSATRRAGASARPAQCPGSGSPLPGHQERRPAPRDRAPRRRAAARAAAGREIALLLPGRLGRGALHRHRAHARSDLRPRGSCRCDATHLHHTFASVADDLGFSELTIAALLGHASRGVTQRYVHIDEALRMAADKIAGEVAAILDGAAGRSAPAIVSPWRPNRFSNTRRHDDARAPTGRSLLDTT